MRDVMDTPTGSSQPTPPFEISVPRHPVSVHRVPVNRGSRALTITSTRSTRAKSTIASAEDASRAMAVNRAAPVRSTMDRARVRSTSANTNASKKSRLAAIPAIAPPTPPAPNPRIRMRRT